MSEGCLTGPTSQSWATMPALIAAVQAAGDAIGLPFIAAQVDLGGPEPMSDAHGRPYAETSFRWIDPDHAYWRDRKLALTSPIASKVSGRAVCFAAKVGAIATTADSAAPESTNCRLSIASTPNFFYWKFMADTEFICKRCGKRDPAAQIRAISRCRPTARPRPARSSNRRHAACCCRYRRCRQPPGSRAHNAPSENRSRLQAHRGIPRRCAATRS